MDAGPAGCRGDLPHPEWIGCSAGAAIARVVRAAGPCTGWRHFQAALDAEARVVGLRPLARRRGSPPASAARVTGRRCRMEGVRWRRPRWAGISAGLTGQLDRSSRRRLKRHRAGRNPARHRRKQPLPQALMLTAELVLTAAVAALPGAPHGPWRAPVWTRTAKDRDGIESSLQANWGTSRRRTGRDCIGLTRTSPGSVVSSQALTPLRRSRQRPAGSSRPDHRRRPANAPPLPSHAPSNPPRL